MNNSPESPRTPLSKQKGFKRIVLGLILIILQIIAVTGGARAGNLFNNSIPYLIGFFSLGVAGIVLIIFGVRANKKQ